MCSAKRKIISECSNHHSHATEGGLLHLHAMLQSLTSHHIMPKGICIRKGSGLWTRHTLSLSSLPNTAEICSSSSDHKSQKKRLEEGRYSVLALIKSRPAYI